MADRIDEEKAFALYAGMGPNVRSYQKVADQLGCGKRSIVDVARRGNWNERIQRIDREAQKRAEAELVEERTKMTRRHIQAAQLLQKKAIERLAKEGAEFTNNYDAARALDLAVKLERLVRGESTDNVNLDGEVVRHVMAITKPPENVTPEQWREQVNATHRAMQKAREESRKAREN